MMSEDVRRCKQCGKIIVGDSKLGICPKCADKDKRGAAGIGVALVGVGLAIKRFGKPAVNLIKDIAKVITKV